MRYEGYEELFLWYVSRVPWDYLIQVTHFTKGAVRVGIIAGKDQENPDSGTLTSVLALKETKPCRPSGHDLCQEMLPRNATE